MTMIATTYPLSHYESRPLATAEADRRVWGFWATLAWFGAAVSVHLALSILCGLGYAVWSVLSHPSAAVDWDSPTANYIAVALSVTAAASVLMYVARRPRCLAAVNVVESMPCPQWRPTGSGSPVCPMPIAAPIRRPRGGTLC
jgi:hypothetical protein